MHTTLFDRYLLRELVTVFVLTIAGLTAILFIGATFKVLTRVPGLDLVFLLHVTPLLLPKVLVHGMPLAALLAAVTVYCRLAGDREILAMRMTGVGSWVVLRPTVFVGLVLTCVSLFASNHLAPRCRSRLDDLTRDTLTRFIASVTSSRNSMELFGFKFHWRSVADGALRDVLVYRAASGVPTSGRDSGDAILVHAASARLRLDSLGSLVRVELSGISTGFDRGNSAAAEGLPTRVIAGARALAFTIDVTSLQQHAGSRLKPKDYSVDALMAFRARGTTSGRLSTWAIDVELGRRLALALSNLTFLLVGAVVGMTFRGTNRVVAYLVAVAIGVGLFFPLTRVAETLASPGALSPWIGSQAGNAALLVACHVLRRRAPA